jgi:phosphoribosylaminoimidazolecarboxamide formyltransferase/IMP cyclohydrolase
MKIKRALISVSNKEGIVDFAKGLKGLGVEIISTGGTAKILSSNGIKVKGISEVTGFPEILGGRVKTLHPKVHGALLARRDIPEHMNAIKELGIEPIDMVVVNLYPFEEVTKKPGVALAEAIENIDIGGPSMLRSAAKNFTDVVVISSPGHYEKILQELKEHNGEISLEMREKLAVEVFRNTSRYDGAIEKFLSQKMLGEKTRVAGALPATLRFTFEKIQEMRYGENPHQKAAFYQEKGSKYPGVPGAKQLHGKELSYNNILDLDSVLESVREFKQPAAVVMKHNSPCGAAQSTTISRAYVLAHKTDPVSAFGGIVGVNRQVDEKTAGEIAKTFIEAVIAPSYSKAALKILTRKKGIRLMELPSFNEKRNGFYIRGIGGGMLYQEIDLVSHNEGKLKAVTKRRPTKKEMEALLFAWKVAKNVKSNAIVIAKPGRTIGIGAGQMSRIDACKLALMKASEKVKGAVLASDAFTPFPDVVKWANSYGIKAVIQPGGALRDEEVIREADRRKVAMVFTGMRHFRH